MDYNSIHWRVIIYFGSLGFLTFLSWMCASNFDETELKLVGGFALGFAGLLFSKELRKSI